MSEWFTQSSVIYTLVNFLIYESGNRILHKDRAIGFFSFREDRGKNYLTKNQTTFQNDELEENFKIWKELWVIF